MTLFSWQNTVWKSRARTILAAFAHFRRVFNILLIAAGLSLSGCRNLEIIEYSRERDWAFSRRIENVAVLEPGVGDSARESILLYPVAPLAYAAQLLSLTWPERAPESHECTKLLRESLVSQLEAAGVHAISTEDVDLTVSERRNLLTAGADYVLHSTIRGWDRGYLVLGSWVRVVIDIQLVRLADGVVVFDGSLETTRPAGLFQIVGGAFSLVFSTPIGGLPIGQVTTVTGPLSQIHGSSYGHVVRDAAGHFARHIQPDALDACVCIRCLDRRSEEAGRRESIKNAGEASAFFERMIQNSTEVSEAVIAGPENELYTPGMVLRVYAVAPPDATVSFVLGDRHTPIPMMRRGSVSRPFESRLELYEGIHVIDESDIPANGGFLDVRVFALRNSDLRNSLPTRPSKIAVSRAAQ